MGGQHYRDPSTVHEELSPEQREIASEQLFLRLPEGRLKYRAYEEFIDLRAREMADRLNEFLGLRKR